MLVALKWASYDATSYASMEMNMRTTIALDEELLSKAKSLTGLKEKSSLVREGLKALIERESALRLALLGGTEPELEAAPRRRP
jgi:Arc/MetJ family transcription regulator